MVYFQYLAALFAYPYVISELYLSSYKLIAESSGISRGPVFAFGDESQRTEKSRTSI